MIPKLFSKRVRKAIDASESLDDSLKRLFERGSKMLGDDKPTLIWEVDGGLVVEGSTFAAFAGADGAMQLATVAEAHSEDDEEEEKEPDDSDPGDEAPDDEKDDEPEDDDSEEEPEDDDEEEEDDESVDEASGRYDTIASAIAGTSVPRKSKRMAAEALAARFEAIPGAFNRNMFVRASIGSEAEGEDGVDADESKRAVNESKLQRKHFAMIASGLAEMEMPLPHKRELVGAIATALAGFNDNFNRARFVKATGLQPSQAAEGADLFITYCNKGVQLVDEAGTQLGMVRCDTSNHVASVRSINAIEEFAVARGYQPVEDVVETDESTVEGESAIIEAEWDAIDDLRACLMLAIEDCTVEDVERFASTLTEIDEAINAGEFELAEQLAEPILEYQRMSQSARRQRIRSLRVGVPKAVRAGKVSRSEHRRGLIKRRRAYRASAGMRSKAKRYAKRTARFRARLRPLAGAKSESVNEAKTVVYQDYKITRTDEGNYTVQPPNGLAWKEEAANVATAKKWVDQHRAERRQGFQKRESGEGDGGVTTIAEAKEKGLEVKCGECGTKFKTKSDYPTCPKCKSSDVDLSEARRKRSAVDEGELKTLGKFSFPSSKQLMAFRYKGASYIDTIHDHRTVTIKVSPEKRVKVEQMLRDFEGTRVEEVVDEAGDKLGVLAGEVMTYLITRPRATAEDLTRKFRVTGSAAQSIMGVAAQALAVGDSRGSYPGHVKAIGDILARDNAFEATEGENRRPFSQALAEAGDPFAKHSTKIALSTLKMHELGARVMGGMTHTQAIGYLYNSADYSREKIEGLLRRAGHDAETIATWMRAALDEAKKPAPFNPDAVLAMAKSDRFLQFSLDRGLTPELIYKSEIEGNSVNMRKYRAHVKKLAAKRESIAEGMAPGDLLLAYYKSVRDIHHSDAERSVRQAIVKKAQRQRTQLVAMHMADEVKAVEAVAARGGSWDDARKAMGGTAVGTSKKPYLGDESLDTLSSETADLRIRLVDEAANLLTQDDCGTAINHAINYARRTGRRCRAYAYPRTNEDGSPMLYESGARQHGPLMCVADNEPPSLGVLVFDAVPLGEAATGETMFQQGDEPVSVDRVIRVGDRVTISTRHGSKLTGRAVMLGPAGWVLNLGGKHGTPGIATDQNVVTIKRGKSVIYTMESVEEAEKYARKSARGGDYSGNENSDQLARSIRANASRANTADDIEHAIEQVQHFAAAGSLRKNDAASLVQMLRAKLTSLGTLRGDVDEAKKVHEFKAGDRVAYKASFLRSIGMATGLGHARGVVTKLEKFGQAKLVTIQWEGGKDTAPERVLDANLSLVSPTRGIADESVDEGIELPDGRVFDPTKGLIVEAVRKQLDFDDYAAKARRMSNAQLHGALLDIKKTLDGADKMDRAEGTGEGGYYRDQASVLRKEVERRRQGAARDEAEDVAEEEAISVPRDTYMEVLKGLSKPDLAALRNVRMSSTGDARVFKPLTAEQAALVRRLFQGDTDEHLYTEEEYAAVDEAKRKKMKGYWRTTERGQRIFIENGKVTKGNPHLMKALAGR